MVVHWRMLTAEERDLLLQALQSWATSAPPEPVIGFLGRTRLFTPKEISDEVAKKTPDGEAVLEILEHGVRREGVTAVIERIKRQATRH